MLTDCNTLNARYLFQQDKHYDVSYDTGDKVIQCGRHNDIFKFWLQWRARVSDTSFMIRMLVISKESSVQKDNKLLLCHI